MGGSHAPDRLIYMANQIGKLFRSQGHDGPMPGITDIKKIVEPRMRKADALTSDVRRQRA